MNKKTIGQLTSSAALVAAIVGCADDRSSATLTKTQAEEPGDHCPYGGQRVDAGQDTNRDGKLSASEVEQTIYACNGEPGASGLDGSSGLTALVSIDPVDPGSQCAAGGQRIRTGLDANHDGTLDADEASEELFVCNGQSGQDGQNGQDGSPGQDGANGGAGPRGIQTLVAFFPEAAGEHCPAGGQRVDFGSDLDEDSTLDAEEVEGTTYMCNGVDGMIGLSSLVVTDDAAPSEECPQGGLSISVGIDENRNQTLDEEEVSETRLVCHGLDGQTALSKLTPEEPGEHCAAGGQKVTVGLDANQNHELDEEEVQDTSFVCNGVDGQNGADGVDGYSTLTNVSAIDPGEVCTAGGQMFEIGLDNGDDDGIVRNLVLESGEVDSSKVVCNGENGTDGVGGIRVTDGAGTDLGRLVGAPDGFESEYYTMISTAGYLYQVYYYNLSYPAVTAYFTTSDCTGTIYVYGSSGELQNYGGKQALHHNNLGWLRAIEDTAQNITIGSYKYDGTCYAQSYSVNVNEAELSSAEAMGLPDTVTAPLFFE